MKKVLLVVLTVVVGVFCLLSTASATPKMVLAGVKVSATIEGDVATVTITGVAPTQVEVYQYEGIKKLGAVNTFQVNLNEGRRFNFKFKSGDSEYFALLTPDMVKDGVDIFGSHLTADFSDSRGGAFKITKK